MKSTNQSPLAFSYLRFSSPAQAEGDSVRRQTALRDAWLKRHPEVRLDTSLSLVDAGVSGYRGEHRMNKRHALASFVDLAERGRVSAGSYLIVENLDRLTREQPVDSIPAVLSLIKLGIRVVQLAPTEVVYTADMDQGALMMMLWELSRGHGESKRKAGLSGEAWSEKKRQARANRTPHGGAVPAWLELADDKYRVRQDAGRAVRRIFRLSAEGLGTLAIAARLNKDKVPPIARGDKWIRSYVAKILDNRAALGEYQPMKGSHGRTPDGEPVADYFPRVVSDQEWYAAHAGKLARNKRCGRPGRKGDYTFPFSGLLRCALDRCPLHVITRKGRKFLVSAYAVGGEEGAHWCPFPLDVFNTAILSRLKELQASDLFSDPEAGRVAELTGRLAEVEKRLAAALARFDSDPESPTWSERVTKYDREKRALVKELAEARQVAACPASAAWAEAVTLMAKEEPARLRAALLATVDSVCCVLVARGKIRVCAAQVWFEEGKHRSYLLWYRPAAGGFVGKSPEHWWVRSLDDVAMSAIDDVAMSAIELDLRKPADAKKMEKALADLDAKQTEKVLAALDLEALTE